MNPKIGQDEISAYIGQQIRDRRKSVGMTQADLAIAIGEPQSELSKMERGLRRFYVDTLHAAARALGCSIVALLPPEPNDDINRAIRALDSGGQAGALDLIALGTEIARRSSP